ncbi:hypothetical protein ACE1OA_07540 [Streptomyces sp. JL2001]|uniref:hypothetical protein n=1 Tax=Streptomyces sp. NPDC059442 TaxID=3346830 RepID=UPI003680BABF
MGESVPVRCPRCLRTHAFAAPAFPCACGAPVTPSLVPGETGVAITHRNWSDEWVVVPCAACGRRDEWPHPELGCVCGTVLRVPVQATGAADGTAGRPAGPGEETGPGAGGHLVRPGGTDTDGASHTGQDTHTAGDGDEGPGSHPWVEPGPAAAAAGREETPRTDPDTSARPPAAEPAGTAPDPYASPPRAGEPAGGPDPERGSERADAPAPESPTPDDDGTRGDAEAHTAHGAGHRAAARAAGGGQRPFAERYPAHIPLPPTAPVPPPPRSPFRPMTIRTARDAVAASAGYLRWLGFRDVVQPEERVADGVDLRAPGLVAQVDPSTRPAALRAVECLWLNGLSASAVSVFFSLAGYTPEARSRADELGIPLFVLDLTGAPQPVNGPAGDLASGA